jgi:hypothetical protein
MKRIVIAILAAMLVAGAQTKDEAERLLKAARNVELVDGNLNAAIRQYDTIIAKYRKTDREPVFLPMAASCHSSTGKWVTRMASLSSNWTLRPKMKGK